MPLRCLAVVGLCVLLVGCSASDRGTSGTKGSLKIEPPAGWQIEHAAKGGTEAYELVSPIQAWLTVSKTPPLNRHFETEEMLRRTADEFLAIVKKKPNSKITSTDYQVKSFAGDQCKGSYAVFNTTTAGTVQVAYVMSVNGQMWDGQFIGPTREWEEALKTLASVKQGG